MKEAGGNFLSDREVEEKPEAMDVDESDESDPDFCPGKDELRAYSARNASVLQAPSTRSQRPIINATPNIQIKMYVKDLQSSTEDMPLVTAVLAEQMGLDPTCVIITNTEEKGDGMRCLDIDLVDVTEEQLPKIQEVFISYNKTCRVINQRLKLKRPDKPVFEVKWIEIPGSGEDEVPEQRDYKLFIKALSAGLDLPGEPEEEDEPWEPTENQLESLEDTLIDNKDKINGWQSIKDNLMRELQKDARDDGNYTIDLTHKQSNMLRDQLHKHFHVLLQAHYDLKGVDREKIPPRERKIVDNNAFRIKKLLVELASARNGAKKSLCKTLYKRQVNFGTFSSDQHWTRSQPNQMEEETQEVESFFDIPGLKEFPMLEAEGHSKEKFDDMFYLEPVQKVKPELSADGWTDSEERLLALAVKLMGFGDRRLPRTHVVNWKEIQARFLPHRTIKEIQRKHAKLKKNRKAFYVGRVRAKPRQMSAEDLHTLAQAVEKKGRKWAEISKEYLPHWNRDELRKRYIRKILPKREKYKKKVAAKKIAESQPEAEPPSVKFINPTMAWLNEPKFQLPSPQALFEHFKEQQNKMDEEDSDSDFEPTQTNYLETIDDEIPSLPDPNFPELPAPG